MMRAPDHRALGFVLAITVAGTAWAQGFSSTEGSVVSALLRWAPLIGSGFVLNLLISAIAMIAGTVLGLFLGLGQVSPRRWLGRMALLLTQFFRNAPWLVLLFFCIFVLPFRIRLLGLTVDVPNWARATVGLTLPVMANVSEIVRGAVNSIPSGPNRRTG